MIGNNREEGGKCMILQGKLWNLTFFKNTRLLTIDLHYSDSTPCEAGGGGRGGGGGGGEGGDARV